MNEAKAHLRPVSPSEQPKVSLDGIAEKVRGAASDCNVKLEYDQTRYIAKAVLDAAEVKYE